MSFGWHDAIGLIGVALILLAYALLQLRRLPAESRAYSLLNALGALAILVSLVVDFNLSAAVMEVAWLLLSLYGLWRARHPHEPRKIDEDPKSLDDSLRSPFGPP